MLIKNFPKLVVAFSFAFALVPARAQVAPQADQYIIPVVAGLGGADFAIDWGAGTRMEGITAWVDVFPPVFPRKLDGIGFEVEGRDLNFNRPSAISKMRQDTGLIGPIYALPRYKVFRPYVKFLAGIGSIDFPTIAHTNYSHDTFLVTAPAGGAEVRVWGHLWLHADYQYQTWYHTFGSHNLNPNGVSFGTSYDFRPIRTE